MDNIYMTFLFHGSKLKILHLPSLILPVLFHFTLPLPLPEFSQTGQEGPFIYHSKLA